MSWTYLVWAQTFNDVDGILPNNITNLIKNDWMI